MVDTKKQYQTARNDIALLDFSDMANLKISGEGATEFLNMICTGEINSLSEGRILNTLICNDDGYIVAIVWILKDDEFYFLHSDTAKKDVLSNWLNTCVDKYPEYLVTIDNLENSTTCLSLIGPKALELPKTLIDEDIIGLQYLGFEHNSIGETDCLICRYGYTGEYEYRILFDTKYKAEISKKLLDTGKEYNIQECGMDILSVLYLEMKSINQNIDIADNIMPLEAGLHWMINFRKDNFIGKNVLETAKEENTYNKFVMVATSANGILKKLGKVLIPGEIEVGKLIHCEYSPHLEKNIAIASIKNHYAWSGLEVLAEVETGDFVVAQTVSAPLFITRTVLAAREE